MAPLGGTVRCHPKRRFFSSLFEGGTVGLLAVISVILKNQNGGSFSFTELVWELFLFVGNGSKGASPLPDGIPQTYKVDDRKQKILISTALIENKNFNFHGVDRKQKILISTTLRVMMLQP